MNQLFTPSNTSLKFSLSHLEPEPSSSPSMQNRYNQAKLSIHDRALKVAAVLESLEREMELLCLTGVEDQLQADVRPTLELLRNAGIKVGRDSDPNLNLTHI